MSKVPEVNEYVVVKITQVIPYGAYAELEEYPGWKGFIHISEVASHWVKNIRSHVKEGQLRVAKVLRVYPEKKSVDLSLRRVSQAVAKRKMDLLKRAKRGKHLLSIAEQMAGETSENVVEVLEREFGDILGAFESAALEGKKALEGVDIPEKWKEVIVKVAERYIEVPKKKVMAVMEIIIPGPYGAREIRNILKSVMDEVLKSPHSEVRAYVMGVPRYAIEITSYDYKSAEQLLSRALEQVENEVRRLKGEFSWERVKT